MIDAQIFEEVQSRYLQRFEDASYSGRVIQLVGATPLVHQNLPVTSETPEGSASSD